MRNAGFDPDADHAMRIYAKGSFVTQDFFKKRLNVVFNPASAVIEMVFLDDPRLAGSEGHPGSGPNHGTR